MPTNRRSFLARMSALSAASLFGGPARAHAITLPNESPWDLSWLDGMKGKHKQVFDLGGRKLDPEHNALQVVRNYLNAHHDVYGLDYPNVNTIVGITSDAFPLNASDDIWKKFLIGERWKITDPATNAPATRNIFLDLPMTGAKGPANIRAMLDRGTAFWQCNNALDGVVSTLAEATKRRADELKPEIVAGLLPHVKLVPAHTMLIGLAQEHGFTYEKL